MRRNRIATLASLAVLATGGVGFAAAHGALPTVPAGHGGQSVPPPKKCHGWVPPGQGGTNPGKGDENRYKVCTKR